MVENVKTLVRRYAKLMQDNVSFEVRRTAWESLDPSDLQVLQMALQMAERDFYEAQQRYDSFVERHYDDRYQPWYEQVCDRYRRRIRREYFQLKHFEQFVAEFSSYLASPADYYDDDY